MQQHFPGELYKSSYM